MPNLAIARHNEFLEELGLPLLPAQSENGTCLSVCFRVDVTRRFRYQWLAIIVQQQGLLSSHAYMSTGESFGTLIAGTDLAAAIDSHSGPFARPRIEPSPRVGTRP